MPSYHLAQVNIARMLAPIDSPVMRISSRGWRKSTRWGTLPTTDEAKSKLEYLHRHGATPLAFTFKQRYTADEMLQTLAAREV